MDAGELQAPTESFRNEELVRAIKTGIAPHFYTLYVSTYVNVDDHSSKLSSKSIQIESSNRFCFDYFDG